MSPLASFDLAALRDGSDGDGAPRRGRALDNQQVENSSADVLIDRIVPGEILVIAFGFVAWETRPAFDFYGRLKKLEQLSGRHLNKILVRDSGNAWYHRKIDGLGEHPDETAASLRTLVRAIAPSKIVTLGQSMGAYAAIMYGLLLDAQQIIAFGPLSFLDVAQAELYHERRWLPVMRELALKRPPSIYDDLAALARARIGSHSALHIIFGTHPGHAEASEAVNLDAMHAHRIAAAGRCSLSPFPDSGHAVVQHLIETKKLDALLALDLFGLTLQAELEPEPELNDSWRGWIVENLLRGADQGELAGILQKHGFSHATSMAALAAAQSSL